MEAACGIGEGQSHIGGGSLRGPRKDNKDRSLKCVLHSDLLELSYHTRRAPRKEHGFGYLHAVREVFSDASKNRVDSLPSGMGMGP
jgi:hypothetical protein